MTREQPIATCQLARTMPHARHPQLQGAALAAALSYLKTGETLHAGLRIHAPGAADMRIAISFTCDGSDSPALSGMRLAEPAYGFGDAADTGEEVDLPHAWNFCEYPAGAGTRDVGFRDRTASSGPETLLLDTSSKIEVKESPWRCWDDVVDALLAMGTNAVICMAWTAKEVPVSCARSDTVDIAATGAALHLSISVRAGVELPANLLRAIGSLAFNHPDFAVLATGEEQAGPIVLRRLATCQQEILPSPDCLMRAGVRRGYSGGPAQLPDSGTSVGVIEGAHSTRTVRIPAEERLRHVCLAGMTGTGKSTMLLEMFHGDVASGAGCLLIDPHGDLFEDALRIIPKSRLDDVILLDASDPQRPFPLNVLAVPGMDGARGATFIINELLAIFNSLYNMSVAGGPVFELYFRAAMRLLLLSDLERPCLADLARVFEDRAFRRRLLEQCSEADVVRFWKQTAMRTSGDAALENMAPYIFSKVNHFVADANLKPILSARAAGVDLAEAMDSNKIVLVNLAKGSIGAHSARFLGMVLMTRLLAATLGRAVLQRDQRKPFYLHVDEFQALATESSGTFLAEARKYGVGCTLATQTLGGLDGAAKSSLAESVTGNCGTMIMTRLGPVDADRLARTYGPALSPTEMQALPSFHAVGSFVAREVPPRPFVFKVPLPRKPRHSRAQALAAIGRNSPAHHPLVNEALALFPKAEVVNDDEASGAPGKDAA